MKTLLTLFSLTAIAATALAQTNAPGALPGQEAFFDDPEWRDGFLASYAVLREVEPKISEDEREVLQDVLELMQNSPRAAAARLEQDIKNSSSAALNFILANLSFQTGDTEKAKEQYAAAIEKESAFLRAHKNLGLLYIQDEDLKEGIKHLSRAIELGAREARLYGLLGYCYLNMNKSMPAEEAYSEAVVLEPENLQWQLGLLQSLMNQKDYEEALEMTLALLEEDPSDLSLWKIRANAQIGIEKPLEAATSLEMARMLGEKSHSTLSLLGDIYMNQQMFGLARDTYLYSLNYNADSRDFTSFLRAARLLYRTQNFEESQQVVDAIAERFEDIEKENNLDLLTLKAQLQRKLGNPEEAAKTLETIVERDGTRGEALIELAEYYWASDQAELALIKLDQAANLKDEDIRHDALVKKAQFLVKQRAYREAADHLRQALRIKQKPSVQRYFDQVQMAAANL